MQFLVRVKLAPLDERFRTQVALIGLVFRMLSRVRLQVAYVGKLQVAL